MKALVGNLEKHTGPLDEGAFSVSLEKGRQVSRLIQRLYELRARHGLALTNKDFYRALRSGEYLHPDQFIPLLESLKEKRREGEPSGPSVLLSGILPNPPEILSLLDDLDIRIADDDLLNGSRRWLVTPSEAENPYEILADGYFGLPPCSTKDSPIRERVQYILEKIQRTGAQGVIFYMVKFCEPELFDVPLVVEALRARGIKTLVVDVELNQGLSGQLTTRIEAFVEMLQNE
jgi:benzoyl-CoA reductase/2-hydroxyglutaryl-CoA dehydratase subunit BcrC/BadD/HgdB